MTNNSVYQWIPKKGISPDAIERMRKHFHKPSYPMGEAWFNTDKRRFYTELIQKSVGEIDTGELSTNILFQISSGTKSFGHREEWDEWFKYLLPDLILRSEDFNWFSVLLAPSVVTAFMSIYWKGLEEEYEGFRNDVLNSLSLCLMNDDLWFDYHDKNTGLSHPKARFLDCYKDGRDQLRLGWNTVKADENLSALMFFCLKYLYPEEIISWVNSLFLISDRNWKGALTVWLLGAYDLLRQPIVIPSKIKETEPAISWDSSHCLGSIYGSIEAKYPPSEEYNDNKDFLPSENTKVFLEEIRKHLTDEVIIEWAELFAQDKYVLESTYNVPELLLEKLSK